MYFIFIYFLSFCLFLFGCCSITHFRVHWALRQLIVDNFHMQDFTQKFHKLKWPEEDWQDIKSI